MIEILSGFELFKTYSTNVIREWDGLNSSLNKIIKQTLNGY